MSRHPIPTRYFHRGRDGRELELARRMEAPVICVCAECMAEGREGFFIIGADGRRFPCSSNAGDAVLHWVRDRKGAA